ncbi:hypothetical protein L226DRAFT_471704 [Lentinus tigrinus ALCF2SS1-7]|nr:hypothetical protein L226DRAFT_471704 [Lentinus tigrinus ALCF2SS1-7]
MPIFNLPTLPPPTPAQPARHAPLRSLPALPMQGPSDADQEADVEDASLEEEEDEEEGDDNAEGNGQDVGSEESGDEDDESSPSLTSSNNAGPSRLAPLPQVDLSGFSVSFGDAGISSSMQQFMQHTPHLHPADPPVDYFSAKSLDPVHSPLRTPRPSDYRPNGKARAFDGVPQPRLVPMPATPGSPRPGLYHQGSKSMVDLTAAMVRKDKDKVITPKLGRTPPRKAQTLGQDGQAPAAEAEDPATTEPLDDVITSPMLRRRRSLPVYEPSSDPPPYPDPLFRRRGQPSSQPREEEGREQLPAYSNSIYLSGIMPRKMEFSQPGVQAKDRKWRRVYCVLEGTAFRVYKCPPAASGVSAIEQWWENRVGVGDLTSVNITAITSTGIRVSAIRERQRESTERIPKIVEESGTGQDMQSPSDRPEEREASQSSPAPTKSKLGLASRFLRKERSKSVDPLRSNSANSSRTRLSMDSRSDAARQPSIAASRRSMDTLSSSRPSNVSTTSPSTTSTNLTVPSPTSASSISSEGGSRFSRSRLLSHHSSRREHHRDFNREKEKEETYTPDPKDLIHQYSLQHAESGLASDYQKRKNVIRVRMEGEQFLLQAKDVAAVIDWIEGIQMGTNVALDLDERPMPRGPIFPRRRRRRVRRVDPAVATAS